MEERRKAEVRNNVLLSPVPEVQDENLRAILLSLVPDIENHQFDAVRVGREREQAGRKSRLVLIRTTAAGKKILMSQRNLKFRDVPVYFNHDLTRAEREERKRLLPSYKSLRAANIQCSFPRDRIIQDGKEMSDEEIAKVLSQ